MTDLTAIIRRLGGVATTAELRSRGHTKRMLAIAVHTESIIRIRIGHYGLPETHGRVIEALRVGGRICCISAARLHGMRVLRGDENLHVSVGLHDSKFRTRTNFRCRFEPSATFVPAQPEGGRSAAARQLSPSDGEITLHWDAEQTSPTSRHLVGVEDCIVQLINCLPALDAICVLDSALEIPREGKFAGAPLLDEAGLMRVRARVAEVRARAVVDRASGLSQAIGESVARCRFQDAGVTVVAQAPLPGGFVGDLLIGEWILFECNGEAPHTLSGAFDRDQARRAWLMAHGFHILDFSHNQILDEWPMVISTVQLLMRRGMHTHPF